MLPKPANKDITVKDSKDTLSKTKNNKKKKIIIPPANETLFHSMEKGKYFLPREKNTNPDKIKEKLIAITAPYHCIMGIRR